MPTSVIERIAIAIPGSAREHVCCACVREASRVLASTYCHAISFFTSVIHHEPKVNMGIETPITLLCLSDTAI
jgi:hypothetical protein